MSEAAGSAKASKKAEPASRKTDVKKILGADISTLSEAGRIAHIALVRDAVASLSRVQNPEPAILADRIRLLRMWNALVKLRAAYVREDGPPPDERAAPYRKRAPGEIIQDAANAGSRARSARASAAPGSDGEGSSLVKLRLVKAGLVRGVSLPAGILIEVEPHDAEELIESGTAERLAPPGP